METEGRVRELVEVELPDGRVMWASVESPDGPRDVGLAARVSQLPGFPEVMEWVGTAVSAGLRSASPDQISVEFGVELAVGNGGIVAALGGVGAKAAVKVTMRWGGDEAVSRALTQSADPD
jgi:hypothetical protein